MSQAACFETAQQGQVEQSYDFFFQPIQTGEEYVGKKIAVISKIIFEFV